LIFILLAYIVRRVLYAVPILLGVNILTFILFFSVNTPNDIARMHLGKKNITQQDIKQWKQNHGYDLPLLINNQKSGLQILTQTIFFQDSVKLLAFNFGQSDNGRDIGHDIRQRMGPSLAIAIPTLLLGLVVHITFAALLAFFRRTYLDVWGVSMCIMLMSVSSLFYIIGGQFLFGKVMRVVPISGYQYGFEAWRFVLLPILIGIISGMGASVRWYRTLFLEEMTKDYVKTARAKGVSETRILFKHVLKNSMIPILTGIIYVIPLLFTGSLVMETFFGIPGLGSYMLDAIHAQDFAIVHSMVFLGSVLYIIGLILTDISYTLVDPRVKLA
jgi:peptide/nickel transport system permease protein